MADVFVSYAREDAERVQQVVDAMLREGIVVWWDRLIPSGANWDKTIEAEIFNAPCVLVLWSRRSTASENCRCEADFARGAGILIPALLETCELPLFHRMMQYSDLRSWSGEKSDVAWVKLVDRIKSHLKLHAAPDPRTALERWGFGIAPPQPKIWKRYNAAAMVVENLLKTQQVDDKNGTLAALSEVKGLFNRIRRKDQWDWFIVWQRLGFPRWQVLWPIVDGLQRLRSALKDDTAFEIQENITLLRKLHVPSLICKFLGKDVSFKIFGSGMVFVLSAKNHSDVLFVGGTEGDVIEIADQLSKQLGATQPFGIIGAWRVHDVDKAKTQVFEQLARNGFASALDRVLSGMKVIHCDYKKALPMIEEVLEEETFVEPY